jgi:hypothetical protein
MTVALKPPTADRTQIALRTNRNSLVGIVAGVSEDNRRWAKRRASATVATLQGPDLGDPVPCLVLDTSSTGARIRPHLTRGGRFHSIKELPTKFVLLFTIDRVAIDCKIAWRTADEVGLKFVSPARTLPKPPQRPKIGTKKK